MGTTCHMGSQQSPSQCHTLPGVPGYLDDSRPVIPEQSAKILPDSMSSKPSDGNWSVTTQVVCSRGRNSQ